MLALFRRNLNTNLLAVTLFAFLLGSFDFFLPTSTESAWPSEMSSWISKLLPNNFLLTLLSVILITAQAYLVNNLVIKHKLSRALSTIPAAIFVIFCYFAIEPEAFHPILLANLFALLSLDSLYRIYKKHFTVAILFNSGLFMAIAALIYPPYILFIVLLFLGLFSLRNISVKESLQLLIGSLAPLYLIGVFFFFKGNFALLSQHFTQNLTLPWTDTSFDPLTYLKVIITMIIIFGLLTYTNNSMKKKKFDAIKKIELGYWMLFLSVLTPFFISQLTEAHLLICSIPIAIIGGLFMEAKKNAIIKEFLFLVFVGLFVSFRLGIV